MKKEISLLALKRAKNDLNKESEKLEKLLEQKANLEAKISKQETLIADKTEVKNSAELKLFGELASASGLTIFAFISAMQTGSFDEVIKKLKNSGIDKDVLNEIFELMKEQPKEDEKKADKADNKTTDKADDKAADEEDEADNDSDDEDDEDSEDKSVPSSSTPVSAYNNGYQG